jgi:hypothetical protein
MAANNKDFPKNLTKVSFDTRAEEERLKEDIFRPDIEKLHLFTQMLRRNALFQKAKVVHK